MKFLNTQRVKGYKMDLRNVLAHKAGTKVMVEGAIYEIGADGICRGLSDDAAKKLLQNSAWVSLDAPSAPAKPAKAKDAAKVVLLTEDDKPVEGQKVLAEQKPLADVAVNDASSEIVPESDEDGAEWPDPTEDMDIEYLREMADAYQVSYSHRSGKALLVKKITDAMYGEGE